MRRLATLLTVILLVAACRASAAEHKLFAWRVAGDPGTVYLLGSIHVGKPDLYPLPQPIEQAFADSAELVEEIDMSGANLALLQQQVLQRGLYTGGDKIENHLSPTTRAALAAYLQRTGQAPTALSAMRPWLADMQIHTAQLQALGFAPQYAIDRHFLDEAAAAKKPVAGLETIGFQVDLLSGLPDDLQDKLMFSELVDADNLAGDAAALVQAWRTGDTVGMEATATRAERLPRTAAADRSRRLQAKRRDGSAGRGLPEDAEDPVRRRRQPAPGRRSRHPEAARRQGVPDRAIACSIATRQPPYGHLRDHRGSDADRQPAACRGAAERTHRQDREWRGGRHHRRRPAHHPPEGADCLCSGAETCGFPFIKAHSSRCLSAACGSRPLSCSRWRCPEPADEPQDVLEHLLLGRT